MASKDFMRSTRRETIVIVALYLLFFAWWYVTAYGFGDDPAVLRWTMGFTLAAAVLLWYLLAKPLSGGARNGGAGRPGSL